MSLIRLSADNPAALLAIAVLVIVLGVIGIVSLPIQMLPNIEYPEININTSWRSAAPPISWVPTALQLDGTLSPSARHGRGSAGPNSGGCPPVTTWVAWARTVSRTSPSLQ